MTAVPNRNTGDDQAELDRFKRDINLTEYAAHLGYEIERRSSSRHSVAMMTR
jgi:hypothetical protein